MNHRGCSYDGFTIPEADEKVVEQLHSMRFVNEWDNIWYHPDFPDHKIDVSHTEENGLLHLLYETYFLAGYKKKEDEIKLALGIK